MTSGGPGLGRCRRTCLDVIRAGHRAGAKRGAGLTLERLDWNLSHLECPQGLIVGTKWTEGKVLPRLDRRQAKYWHRCQVRSPAPNTGPQSESKCFRREHQGCPCQTQGLYPGAETKPSSLSPQAETGFIPSTCLLRIGGEELKSAFLFF